METFTHSHNYHLNTGAQAEKLALQFLSQQKLSLVKKNFHSRFGEIDLIMRNTDTLIFVEVKYRNSLGYGHAIEAVTYHKQRKLRRTADIFLASHNKPTYTTHRFDILGIVPYNGQLEFTWLQNAFS